VSPLDLDVQGVRLRGPASINFSEGYSALQIKSSRARKIRCHRISTGKLYEGAEILLADHHMWDGFWFPASQPPRLGKNYPSGCTHHR
jgi:hypothetical protein